MNLPQLGKDPRQRMLVEIGMAVLLVVVVFVFSVIPLSKRQTGVAREVRDFEQKINMAKELEATQDQIEARYSETTSTLSRVLSEYMPPRGNALLWASEQVSRAARSADMEIESINEVAMPQLPWEKKKRGKRTAEEAAAERKKARKFVPYAVDVSVRCGLDELIKLIRTLETNPYFSTTSLSITVREQTPEQHPVRMTIQWIRYTGDPLPMMP